MFSIAAEQSNVETGRWMKKLADSNLIWKVREPTSDDLRRARHAEFGKVHAQLYTCTIQLLTSRTEFADATFRPKGRHRRMVPDCPWHRYMDVHSGLPTYPRRGGWQEGVLGDWCREHRGLGCMAAPATTAVHDATFYPQSSFRHIVHALDEYVQVCTTYVMM